ncbi:MAG: hypothetical protein JW965_06940 [Bacteroidales bacterium]|nr:hypothetical protein [Bacteroidales bacterium]
MNRRVLLLIISVLICISALPQKVLVEAEIDSADIYIGDQVKYTVRVTQPPEIYLDMPEYADTLYDKLEILSQAPVDTTFEDTGEMVLTKSYTITSFDTGYYQIPPYYLEYETGQGKKRFYSEYVPLRVKRVDITPPDSTDVIFDIIGPEKIGYSVGEILPWVLLAVILMIAARLIYKYLPGRKVKEEEEKPSIPAEPIHIITFRALDKLERKQLWQAGKVKEYYSELTEILRYYIEVRYSIPALEMTSEEILSGLGNKDVGPDNLSILRKLLQNADLSKFAKYKHDAVTNESAMQNARDFVKATYKQVEENNNCRDNKKTLKQGKEVDDNE